MAITGTTHIQLLGPFELVHDGRPVEVGGPVGMAIVAALAYPPDTKMLPDQVTATSVEFAGRCDVGQLVSPCDAAASCVGSDWVGDVGLMARDEGVWITPQISDAFGR